MLAHNSTSWLNISESATVGEKVFIYCALLITLKFWSFLSKSSGYTRFNVSICCRIVLPQSFPQPHSRSSIIIYFNFKSCQFIVILLSVFPIPHRIRNGIQSSPYLSIWCCNAAAWSIVVIYCSGWLFHLIADGELANYLNYVYIFSFFFELLYVSIFHIITLRRFAPYLSPAAHHPFRIFPRNKKISRCWFDLNLLC